jgi:NADH:ubiquinone oxidoreductase subunit E
MTSRPESPATGNSSDAGDERTMLRARAREAITCQPARTVTVLSSLLAAHDELGYLPPEAIEEVAVRTSASPNEVWGVASFYPNFRFTVPGRHKIELCWGPTCHVLGAQNVLQGLLSKLGLQNEGDTTDGAITLKLNTCLGVCPHAPAMSLDEQLVGHIDLPRAVLLVERILTEDEGQQRAISLKEEGMRESVEQDARASAESKPGLKRSSSTKRGKE